MNVKERVDWLAALKACFPKHDLRAMELAAEGVDGRAKGRWELSVRGGEPGRAGLRFFGAEPSAYGAWQAGCSEAFGLGPWKGAPAPAKDGPWLQAAWDLKTGRWTALRFFGAGEAWDFSAGRKTPARRRLQSAPYRGRLFGEPALDEALKAFHGLCPIARVTTGGGGWSLRLEAPVRWPQFARTDLSAAFTAQSSQLGLFLLDRRVAELSFDGEALWAHCAG